MPPNCSHYYIPIVFFWGGERASDSMQASLFSMLLPALVVDGAVVVELELPNKIYALRL